MFERDYLMNLLMQFFRGLLRVNELRHKKDDPKLASELLEAQIAETLEMDGAALLQLSPDSIAQVMRVMNVDPNVMQFVARSLLLDAVYLSQAGEDGQAIVRSGQAHAIAAEYGFELPENAADFESIIEGLEEAALEGGFQTDGAGDLESLLDEALGMIR